MLKLFSYEPFCTGPCRRGWWPAWGSTWPRSPNCPARSSRVLVPCRRVWRNRRCRRIFCWRTAFAWSHPVPAAAAWPFRRARRPSWRRRPPARRAGSPSGTTARPSSPPFRFSCGPSCRCAALYPSAASRESRREAPGPRCACALLQIQMIELRLSGRKLRANEKTLKGEIYWRGRPPILRLVRLKNSG